MRKELSMEELDMVNGGGLLDQLALETTIHWNNLKNDVSSITWDDVVKIIYPSGDEWPWH